jgi:hypothetical protein
MAEKLTRVRRDRQDVPQTLPSGRQITKIEMTALFREKLRDARGELLLDCLEWLVRRRHVMGLEKADETLNRMVIGQHALLDKIKRIKNGQDA